MELEFVVVVILILLLLFYCCSSSENFIIVNDLKGIYTLSPNFSSTINANRAVSLQVTPQRPLNPNYLDLTIYYANGKSNMVRTNLNVKNIWTYYDDIDNVQYLTDPSKIQYDLHTDNGLFRALTVVNENGVDKLKLMDYRISSRIS